ncbi:class II fructose-bisphosphatase [Candidatus Chloroploca asiatica]|uniref:Fructose-1,6-bisphosphatase n=1 Tax=Candidatus Chloroploca asiatica TaxID=1506545 RepID=A0A2H3KMZ6_9CHLR|nr:class II fructose-bisphosphatase [Candidatus Chloroploca asiatica]PDV99502.1 fructose-1,6-bisphosphatase, class II [Candidatus Chloroploca asiatica]
MSEPQLHRNTGLDLVRATEAAAMAAARWMGLGYRQEAELAASQAMSDALAAIDLDGRIVICEGGRLRLRSALPGGERVGSGRGAPVDVVVDAIDGRRLLARGRPGAVAVAAVAPQGTMWAASAAVYMEKIVVNRVVAPALVPECITAPAAWTIGLIARAKGKAIRDLVIFVLERPRHADLITEIRAAGARVMLADDGDISGAVLASLPDGPVDALMGSGGAAEGVMAACAVKALGGGMLARLAPQSVDERMAVVEAGLDLRRTMMCDDLVRSNQIFFVATGITDGLLLDGVHFDGPRATTNSLILRSETRTRRMIVAEHLVEPERP